MYKFLKKFLLLAFIPAAIAGCAEMYLPRFDGVPLNPDITLLRTGEMLEGVKCATVAFMAKREKDLQKERESWGRQPNHPLRLAEMRGRDGPKVPKKDRLEFSPYHLNWNPNTHNKCGYDKHWGCRTKDCNPKECIENACDSAHIDNEGTDRRLGVSVWDYKKRSSAGQQEQETGCTPIPDYSRFALDDTQSAEISITLAGVNSGYVDMPQLDGARGPLSGLFEVGNRGLGAPFPRLLVTPKQSTTFKMKAVLPQSLHTYRQSAPASAYGPSSYKLGGSAGARPSNWRDQLLRDQQHKTISGQGFVPKKDKDSSLLELDVLDGQYPPLFRDSKSWTDLIASYRKELNAAISDNRLKEIAQEFQLLITVIDALKQYINNVDQQIQQSTLYTKVPKIENAILVFRADALSFIRKVVWSDIAKTTGGLTPESMFSSLASFSSYKAALATMDSFVAADQNTEKAIQSLADAMHAKLSSVNYKTGLAEISKLIQDLKDTTASILSQTDSLHNTSRAKTLASAAKQQAKTALRRLTMAQNEAWGLMAQKPEAKQRQEFVGGCNAEEWTYQLGPGRRIDFLGLRAVLDNALLEQEKTIYQGIPDVALDQLILTSMFQLSVEVSGGVTFFRFIPQLIPSTLDMKVDHTHTLEITFKGKKLKGSGSASRNLERSCSERLGASANDGGSGKSDRDKVPFCSSDQGKMLESILQALEKSGGSGASAQ